MTFVNPTTGKARPLLALMAIIGWVAVFLQLYLSVRFAIADGGTVGQGVVRYFGYFTVLTNLLVCLATTSSLLAPSSALGRFFEHPVAVGWVAASIAFVGVAYYVLLRRLWQPYGLQLLSDVLLHYVVPALFVIYSVMVLRGAVLRWTAPLWWSIYLAVYFVYLLVRGALVGSYPYEFLDASALGYAVTLRNGVFLWLAFLTLAYLLMLVWRIGRSRHRRLG
jgi:hypothetical protein